MSAMDNFRPTCKSTRTAKHADLDSELFLWFKTARSINIPISGPIQTKADNLAKMLGVESFLSTSSLQLYLGPLVFNFFLLVVLVFGG